MNSDGNAAPGVGRGWPDAQADALDAIARNADALIVRHGATPAVVVVVDRERKRYSKNQLLRRRIAVPVEQQALASELFFVVDAHLALLSVVPEFETRLSSLLLAARKSPDAVAAWRRLSPTSLEGEIAPPFLRSSLVDTPRTPPSRLHYGRDPFAAIRDSTHGRAEEQVDRLSPSFATAVDHRGDATALEDLFFETFETMAARSASPFGLASGSERERFIRAMLVGQEAETAGTLDWAVTDLRAARDPAAAFAAGFIRLASGPSPQEHRSQPARHQDHKPDVEDDEDDNSESASLSTHARLLGTFDVVRLAAAVQLRWRRDHAEDLRSESAWHPQLVRAAFPRPADRPNVASWSGMLLELAPYSAAIATELNELWPAGSIGALAAAARDFRASDFELGRRDEVIAAARPAALAKYWRQRLGAEQLGRHDPATGWTPINAALSSLLRLEISDLFEALNRRPIEVDPPGHSIRPGGEDVDTDQWAGVSPDNTGGATTDPFSHRIRNPGSDLNYERQPGESSEKSTPIPWIDEFLEHTGTLVTLWKWHRQRAGIAIGRSDAESLRILVEFSGWLCHTVETREVQAVERARLLGGGLLDAKFQPLEIAIWRESRTYPGGLAAGLNAWTASIGALTSNERENRRARVMALMRRIYSDVREEFAPDVYWSRGHTPAGILDDLPATVLSALEALRDGRTSS